VEARLTHLFRRIACLLLALSAVVSMPTVAAARPSVTTTGDPVFDARVERIKADMLADPVHAVASASAALTTANQVTDPRRRAVMRATAQWLMGEAFGRQGEPLKAVPLLAAAHKSIAQTEPRSRLAADILLSEGSVLTDTGRIAEALQSLQGAHALFQQLSDPRSAAKSLILIAILYDRARDHTSALRYYGQAIEAVGKDPGLSLAIYNGRGMALLDEGRLVEAQGDFARALSMARQMHSPVLEALALGNLATTQLRLGQLAKADQSIAIGLRMTASPDAAAVRGPFLAFAADSALRHGDIARARRLIAERFDGVDLTKTIRNDREDHEVAYRVDLAAGDTQGALAHLTAMKRLDDQATEIARSSSAALAAAQFDYTNQELRITKLKADDLSKTIAFERATARTQRQVFVGAAAATALVIAMLAFGLFTIRRSRNEVRAANADLAASNVALEKALAAKTEFLATTSHEIRTPLNGILGMTQVMIADRAIEQDTRERLRVVQGAGMTMLALVDDILDIAKIETGRMTVEMAPMDLRATVGDALPMWRDAAREKGLAFAVDMDDAPQWITGDAARLRQIVFNLLSNAVKFTPSGAVSVTLAARDDRLRMVVRDTGIGIAAEAHEVIFESFRQADTCTTREFGGTGLGLAICRNLAKAMHGDVTVESRPGAGATFTVDIALVSAEAPGVGEERAALLVVERNPITRAMYRTLFEPLGVVAMAGDTAEALAMIGRDRPERLLIDLAVLPDDAPEEMLARIVAATGEGAVTLLTPAIEDPGTRARWVATGIARLVERPIGKKALVEAVSKTSTALVPKAA
jgi:signal transduction histidine kinase/CheY-like chemotaxis protein